MHAYIDTAAASPQPVKVTFYIKTLPGGTRELREVRYPAVTTSGPYWTFSSTALSDRLLTRHVPTRTGGDPWLFTYLKADGTVVVPHATSPTSAITSATTAGADTLRTVARVNVRLVVQADVTSRALPMIITNEVGIPNLGIDRVGAAP